MKLKVSLCPCRGLRYVLGTGRWHNRVALGLLAVVLAFPSVAHPHSLEELLRLPLECLQHLQISTQRTSRAASSAAWFAILAPAEQGA